MGIWILRIQRVLRPTLQIFIDFTSSLLWFLYRWLNFIILIIVGILCVFSILGEEYPRQNRRLDNPNLFSTVPHTQDLIHPSQTPPQHRIKMILNIIIRPPLEQFRDLRPSITIFLVGFEHYFLLFGCPGLLVDFWVQVVVPSKIDIMEGTFICIVCLFGFRCRV